MKEGSTLDVLAAELMRREKAKQDLVVDTRQIEARVIEQEDGTQAARLALAGLDIAPAPMPVTPHAHRQLGSKLGVPAKFYDRLLADYPSLWTDTINTIAHGQPSRNMLRTLDGHVRAVLSDRYRRVDNEDVAGAVLPALLGDSDATIASCEVTDSRLYIKALWPKTEQQVKVGDAVQAGVVISNSEIGSGSLKVEPLIYRLVCTNGMVVADRRWRQFHVGAIVADVDGVALRSETQAAQDKALMLTLVDMLKAARDTFGQSVEKLRAAADSQPIEKPIKAIEILAKRTGLTQAEGESVLERLIRDKDYSKYGAANAVTNLANDVDSYDRASELEVIGGNVIDLSSTDWRQIAEAA